MMVLTTLLLVVMLLLVLLVMLLLLLLLLRWLVVRMVMMVLLVMLLLMVGVQSLTLSLALTLYVTLASFLVALFLLPLHFTKRFAAENLAATAVDVVVTTVDVFLIINHHGVITTNTTTNAPTSATTAPTSTSNSNRASIVTDNWMIRWRGVVLWIGQIRELKISESLSLTLLSLRRITKQIRVITKKINDGQTSVIRKRRCR